ncbi:unnamed protein product [Cylindrotheca closterium]|uniref:Ubiquitin-like domain-containing protein n=1 Tax=Cylindrotheca closterium TaxID=2856 RepID=A0AAD2FW51_9STRA|nr:unnamed protein product [Cylindrotheca closterium]
MDHVSKPQREDTATAKDVLNVYATNTRYKSTESHPWQRHSLPIDHDETLMEFRQRLVELFKPFYNNTDIPSHGGEATVTMIAVDSDGILLFNDALQEDESLYQNSFKEGQKESSERHTRNSKFRYRDFQALHELGIQPQSHIYAFPTFTTNHRCAVSLHLKFPPPNQNDPVLIKLPSLFSPCIMVKVILVDLQEQQRERQNVTTGTLLQGESHEDMDIDNNEKDHNKPGVMMASTNGPTIRRHRSIDRMRLLFAGKQLENFRRLVDYGIGWDATIFVLYRQEDASSSAGGN